jgi:hypothetical protein
MISCGKESAISTVSLEEVKILPSEHGENLSELISDSGITRARINAQIWDVYSNDTEPYWFFPQGIYLEMLDSLFNAVETIQADTAYYFSKKNLWHLIGNVHAKNESGTILDTSELFWDQKEPPNSKYAIYTYKFTRIDQGDRIISCNNGFHANQSLSSIIFNETSGPFFINEETSPQNNDSINKPVEKNGLDN